MFTGFLAEEYLIKNKSIAFGVQEQCF